MRQADRRLRLVDLLSARARGAEQIDAHVLVVDGHVHVLRFGQHRDGDRGGVDAPLRLRLGHTLDAVYPAFKLEAGIGALAVDIDDGLFHAAQLRHIEVDRLPGEAVLLAIALVHAVQLIGKERRLLAARTRPDLEGTAPLVVAVLGQEQRLEPFFRPGKPFAAGLRLLEQHVPHLARLLLRLRKGGVHLALRLAVRAVGLDQFFRLRALARELFVFLHVRERLGAGEQLPQLVVARGNGVKFCKHG